MSNMLVEVKGAGLFEAFCRTPRAYVFQLVAAGMRGEAYSVHSSNTQEQLMEMPSNVNSALGSPQGLSVILKSNGAALLVIPAKAGTPKDSPLGNPESHC